VLRIRGLTKSFDSAAGSICVLEQLSFDVHDRQFVSILGPSGCGKSTLLRILAGLIPHETGDVSIGGKRVISPRPDVGVVFQTSNMLPWQTVAQNIALGARLRRMPEDQVRPRLAELLSILGLATFEQSYPHQISGGMRQRAALGQALLLDPAIIMMDEPFGALDALTRDRLNVELLHIWQERMKTLVLITHSIAEAVFLSDRVMVMSPRPGRIVHEVEIELPRPRRPEETRADPAFSRYVNELGRVMGVV